MLSSTTCSWLNETEEMEQQHEVSTYTVVHLNKDSNGLGASKRRDDARLQKKVRDKTFFQKLRATEKVLRACAKNVAHPLQSFVMTPLCFRRIRST